MYVISSFENVDVLRNAGMVLEIQGYLDYKHRKYPPLSDEVINLQALQQYLRRLVPGVSKTKAALDTATGLGRGVHFSRRIMIWAAQWESNEEITVSRRGKHAKTRNQLTEGDNFNELRTWILENHKYTITPSILWRHINNVFLPASGIKFSISESTAGRWLHGLGWIYSEAKKGLYFDGHERPDVKEYREVFLVRMEEYEKRMTTVGSDDQTKIIEPSLVSACRD